MKVTLNWLREFVPFEGSAEKLAERMTMLGMEVESVSRRGGDFAGIVVGEVVTREKHPNADKLSVCRVRDGVSERQIVCGANNFAPGDHVALILPGHPLPPKAGEKEPFVIKVGKIRGVESQGMMCSAEELGLDAESIGLKKEDGILILKKDSAVGQPFAAYLGREEADVVYDLEITPNRPDLNSVIGIAREIAADTGATLQLPEAPLPPGEGIASDFVDVKVEAPDLCPRYTARVVRGVQVAPSTPWLRNVLEKVGIRSINNVVDITNYVMLVTGQPLHAFDLKQLGRGPQGKPSIIVRRAREGELFVTLDGREHTLSPENLLIADAEKGVALAGVMGGRNSGVTDATTDVLIESACFESTHVRRTSKRLGIRTDASYRFERGTDVEGTDWACRLAASLMAREASGRPAEGNVDVYPSPHQDRQITLRHQKVNDLLGTALRADEIEAYLASLGLKTLNRRPRSVDETHAPEPAVVRIPSFRLDVKREADLIEEVARLHGVDKITSTPPRTAKGDHPFDSRYDALMEARRLLTGLGLTEVQGQTLISRGAISSVPADQVVLLSNPLSSDMDALRASLLPGLLSIAAHNARRQNLDLGLFEIGRTFRRSPGNSREVWRVAILLSGHRTPPFWNDSGRARMADIYDIKGAVAEFLELIGMRGVTYTRQSTLPDLYIEAASVNLGSRLSLGELGQVKPAVARTHDLRSPVLVAELDLDTVLARRSVSRTFKSMPAFPAVRRDVAMIVADDVTHDAVLQTIRQSKAPYLENAELFDVFRGQNVPAGHKSVAYAVTYRASDRTLTDAEVNSAHELVLSSLKKALTAAIRD